MTGLPKVRPGDKAHADGEFVTDLAPFVAPMILLVRGLVLPARCNNNLLPKPSLLLLLFSGCCFFWVLEMVIEEVFMFSSFLLNNVLDFDVDLGRGVTIGSTLGLDFGLHELLMFWCSVYVVAGIVAVVLVVVDVLRLRGRRGGGDGGNETERRRRV